MKRRIRLVGSWEGMIDQKLIDAFLSVPRERFIPEELLNEAYGDYPLPIGNDQTISQPTTVMLMLQYLELAPVHNVLEIGAGSGYNAAIISRIAKRVTAVEIVEPLAIQAKKTLTELGIRNVRVVTGDGSLGHWPDGPYDRIIVTAACPAIPIPLIEQLREGGMIVAPVGKECQRMLVGRKEAGRMEFNDKGSFVFVPLKGEHGFI